MEHLLQMSKCSIFHNNFKYMIRQKALLWSKGLNNNKSYALTNNMEHGITGVDVGKKSVPKALPLVGPFHQTSYVDNIEICGHFTENINYDQ